ncbi:hypothetical protein ABDB91_03360 [Desulfoscipio sp. XC116]|uniref:hypothetical protein n=1 Tax=Desulfoscipio sp. XC116 TaxID=3144975 RepID=UPI00325B3ABA
MLQVPVEKRAHAADLIIGYYNEAAKTWKTLPTTYDAATGTAAAEMNHFTKYALLER